uniref:Nucleotidyl transferase n=1 Tax=uncultured virus TaxID=340016 RepID=D5L2N3_9VIRU|nr:nucleotidyl transferase [uncultured virus]
MRPTIYLAGPIRNGERPVEWRVKLQQSISACEFFDPVGRDVDPVSDPAGVVNGDLEMIREADGVFVGWHDEVPATGTAMEMRVASATLDMPVVVWRRDNNKRTLSPWVREHSDAIHVNRDDAIWHLHTLAKGGDRR